MRALIDADIFLYEIGHSCQDKEGNPLSWDRCQELLEQRINVINYEVGATEPPLLFLTNQPFINKQLNRIRKYVGEEQVVYRPNFREEIAGPDRPYKGGRKQSKPYHYYNLIVHILNAYETIVMENGLEADDGLCIYQTEAASRGSGDTTICSRDKDVRQCKGTHYSWECGKQAAIGPYYCDGLGTLTLTRDVSLKSPKPPKLTGYGSKYLYAQIIMGDAVDNVGGAKSKGPVAAYATLWDANSESDCYERTRESYRKLYLDNADDKLKREADLVYMIRELDEHGEGIRWSPPVNV
jgi:hypothetical protein